MSSAFLNGGNVHANGIRQHYLRYGGKGPKVLIVPGITSPAITWEFVAERFATQFDTYVLDVRGRGLSSSGPELDYDLDTCAKDIVDFAQAMKFDEYTLVGHSMGARFAIRAEAMSQTGCTQLVLIDPPVSGPGRRAYPSKLPWYIDSMAEATAGCDAEAMRKYCATWTDEQLTLRAEWLHTCDEKAVRVTYDGFHNDDIHQYIPNITIPTLLMVAGKGGVIEPVDEAEMRELLPSISIVKVEKAGHMIPWDDLDGFFEQLTPFLGVKL
ncbi:alpha/beta hydrolase [Photobacterium makurazakiensis]|uniref:alpha/beta fold hydrolase n=1 Tax=Photobacterium makurazakiensis TaxID=2910234 RepID=UPI003D141C48